jgi:hypothetical protein
VATLVIEGSDKVLFMISKGWFASRKARWKNSCWRKNYRWETTTNRWFQVNPFHWIKKRRCSYCRINGNKSFVMIAEKLVQKPCLQIVQMVNSASRSRAPIQNWPTE